VCWKPCSSCWSFDLLREEFLSAPIHSPPLWFAMLVLHPIAPGLAPTKALRVGRRDDVRTTRPRSSRTSRSATATATKPLLQMVALQGVLWEEERAPVARSGTAGAMEVSPAADAVDDGNATLWFAPMPPNCTGRPHGAGASSSHQPGGDRFPGDWCMGWNGPRSHGKRWNA
jgi:hypothetical protein